MELNAPDRVFQLMQLIALALPAIAIYLQVLIKVHQAKQTVEIEGRTANWINERGSRDPRKESNVIEAMPTLITAAPAKRSFSFAIQSLMLFACALLPLLLRIAVDWEFLVPISLISISLGVVGFVFSLGLLLMFSISEIAEEEFRSA